MLFNCLWEAGNWHLCKQIYHAGLTSTYFYSTDTTSWAVWDKPEGGAAEKEESRKPQNVYFHGKLVIHHSWLS